MARAKDLDKIVDPDAPGQPLAQEQPAVVQDPFSELPAPQVPTSWLVPKVLPRYPHEVRVTLNGKQYTFTVNAIDTADAINTVYTENEALRRKYTKCRHIARQLSDKPVNQPTA